MDDVGLDVDVVLPEPVPLAQTRGLVAAQHDQTRGAARGGQRDLAELAAPALAVERHGHGLPAGEEVAQLHRALAEHVVLLAPVVVHDAHGERLAAVARHRHVAAAGGRVEVRVLAGLVEELRAVEVAEDLRDNSAGQAYYYDSNLPSCAC